jgi:hypothetical protein
MQVWVDDESTDGEAGAEMNEKKRTPKEFGTCFENATFAEMKKLMEKKGVGSLCAEMVRKIVERGEGGASLCREMMRSMTTRRECLEVREEQDETAEPGPHDS